MPLKIHDNKEISFLNQLIIKNDGTPLHGEIDIYKRIISDFDKSKKNWHFWHDIKLPIRHKKQSEIQIDFLLICDEGILILEVKGGKIEIINGQFYYNHIGVLTLMERSPFEQAEDYKWALINNGIFNKDQLFLETIVAFPHSSLSKTNNVSALDLSWKLWNSKYHEDNTENLESFCLNVLNKGKKDRNKNYLPNLNQIQLNEVLSKLLPNISENSPYTEVSTQSILEWLKIDNINTLESLSKNNRIIIEGGPGTGKTTIAKAFIKKKSNLRGIYFCWNKLLAKVIKKELIEEKLINCEVFQYESYLLNSKIISYIEFENSRNNNKDKYKELVLKCIDNLRNSPNFICYDYIIIDEAQDILDLGVEILLNELVSVRKKGLDDGNFLLFYDIEQGFNQENRMIDDYIDYLSLNGTHFKLNENKRVPTNKEIVEYANKIINSKIDTIRDIFSHLSQASDQIAIHIQYFNCVKDTIKYIHHNIINNIKNPLNPLTGGNSILLLHSSLNWIEAENGEKIKDRLSDIIDLQEIDENNINSLDDKKLPFTTILKYKGLESKNVFLFINNSTLKDNYELYIGMTRAIINLNIFILNN